MRDTYTVRQTAQLRLFADLAGEPRQQGKLVDISEHTRGRPPERSAGCERACLTVISLPHFSCPGVGDGAH
jgi:hypothetical protein